MGNRPPKPKPPPEEGGGGQQPPPEGGGGGGGQQPPKPPTPPQPPTPPNPPNPPNPPGGGGGQQPPPPTEGGSGEEQPPPASGGGSGEEQPPPPGEIGDGSCGPCSGGPPQESNREPQPVGPSHPLNQLSEDEIRQAVSIIKPSAQNAGITNELIFASVSMKEPRKAELLPFLTAGGGRPARRAWAGFSQEGVNAAYEATVNLDSEQVEELITLPPGTQPSFNSDDPIIIQEVVRNDEEVWARAQRAGVTNKEFLICDAWSYGYNDTPEDRENLRLMDMYLYMRRFEGDNQYAHPLDFLVTVDMITKKVINIVDLPVCPGNEPDQRPVPPPEESAQYEYRFLQGSQRIDVKPLQITQPKGPSFTIDGNSISWQRWEMNIGFNFREGLTLHNITFDDKGRKRPILYRAAISEMVVPYGDPRVPYYRKSAFDMGEYGLGYNANPLTNGCDCLGEIRYMDAVFANSKGEPFVTRNAICIHEEDSGLLQKHTEFRNGQVTVARSRRLVISFIATVTNYDYLYYWIFYQDGTMEVDIKATGLLSVHQLGTGPNCGPGGYGTIMADRINAPYHQHIFCARLDPMIDGQNNTVCIQDVVPLEEPKGSEANPYGNGFTTRYTVLETAGESGTDTNPDLTRTWIVANESVIHPATHRPVGWKLIAPAFSRILSGPESGVYQRAGLARHSIWVTPFDDEQLYAAGKYINQAPGGRDGVDIWAAKDENIRDTDIVCYLTMGLTHIPRVEDYPLMPVEGTSFMFRPSNFFTANPALDVPPPQRKKC